MNTRSASSSFAVVAVAAAAVLLPAALPAQSAQEVLQTALEKHREQTANIDNYTVVQSVMGFETTTYYERQTVDGESMLVPTDRAGSEAGDRVPENPYRLYATLADRAELTGTETVAGEECHVILVDDFSGTELAQAGPGAGSGDWKPETLRMWIDADEHIGRRMQFEGTAGSGDRTSPATFTIHLEDYREVEGLRHPYRMRVETSGLGQQMSEQERAQLQQNMQKMREQMADMSPQQRKMMERVMGGQLEKMEKMLTPGALDFTATVKEIRVNEGPPRDS